MIRRFLAVASFVCALGFIIVPDAGAHALLTKADPADGASLSSAPRSVTLQFTEAPDIQLSRIDVIDTTGATHQRGEPTAVAPRGLRVGVETLPKGVYTVSWRVVSRVDGHLTAGAYAFGVNVSPTLVQKATIEETKVAAVSWLEVAGRFALYIGLILLLGCALASAFVFAGERPGTRSLAGAALLVAFAGLAILTFVQVRAADVSVLRVASTPIGRALVERAVGLAVCAAVLALPSRGRRAWCVGAVAVVATILVHVAAGHAAAGGIVWAKVGAQTVHFTAVGVWIGGLVALLVGIRGASPDVRGRAVRRFSTLAGFALLVVAVTGVERAIQEVGSWSGLFSTAYGRIVIAKIALLGALAALGGVNRYRSVPRAESDPSVLKRVGRVEVAIAAVVLVLAASLASLAPAKSSRAQRPEAVVAEGSDFARTVRARLEITPGHAGVNAFAVEVDVKRGAPVEGVTVRLAPASGDIEEASVVLRRAGARFEGKASAIATPGRWRAVLELDRGVDSVEIPLVFHTRCPSGTEQELEGLRLQTLEIGSGRTVQVYTDPAKAGNNAVHFTFFDDEGDELPLRGAGSIEGSGGDRLVDVRTKRLSAGHVVGNARLEAGTWVFDYSGETRDGDELAICFEDAIS